jgi:3-hydroxy-D-aspartate aldolase
MLSPNNHLIGRPGSRSELDTPALLIDIEAFERNIAKMAEYARTRRVQLRPHAKTHKSVIIARRQIDAGAVGICCATLGEAEVMVQAGIPGVHITSPQVTGAKIERLIALNKEAALGLSVVVDHPDNLKAFDAAAQQADARLAVLIDFTAGHGRTGCADADAVVALARSAAAARGLVLRGIQSYSGNLQHIPTRAERLRRAQEQRSILRRVIQQVRDAGIAVEIVTGAGTGTYDLDSEDGPFTELQVGSYVFMDGAGGRGGRARRQPLSVLRRRARQADPARRRGEAADRDAHRMRHAALRSDRQPARRLSRRAGRYADRHLAGRRARETLTPHDRSHQSH